MDENMVLVCCRLCGEKWRLPKYMAAELSADRGFECGRCRASLKHLEHDLLASLLQPLDISYDDTQN